MKFVKANLYLIICGAVVLLFLGAIVWPIGLWQDELRVKMKDRYNKVAEAQGLYKINIVIPEGPTFTGAVDDNVNKARQKIQEQMKAQLKTIAAMAAEQNQERRVILHDGREIPLLGGKEEDHFLPRVAADPHNFKDDYESMVPAWVAKLAAPKQPDLIAAPPTAAEIDKLFEIKREMDAAKVDRNAITTRVIDVGSMGKADIAFIRDKVSERARNIRMYVTLDSFQREPWFGGTVAPNDQQIFETLVHSWLQQDVINAIAAVNKSAINVGEAGIKRLEKIGVGSSGTGDASGLFYSTDKSSSSAVNLSKSLTGRVSNTEFGVVLVDIAMVVDPAKLEEFFDQLYKQNNGYTILNVKQTAVDPFEAASNGYLYGNVQCIRVEVTAEALLFRKWTEPIMPDNIKVQLGIPVGK